MPGLGMNAFKAPADIFTATPRLVFTLAIHIADLAVHAWDLGTALGRPVELSPNLAASALATWQRVFAGRDLRGIVFADEIMVDADADPTAQLLAFCGRFGTTR